MNKKEVPFWLQEILEKEGDFCAFTHEGYNCEIRRNGMGALCGYVSLPAGHPLHGSECGNLAVHGGITFSKAEEDGSWTIGFDCSHFQDISPYVFIPQDRMSSYKDKDFVIAEIERLVEQVDEVENG